MNIIYILIPIALALGFGFLLAFIRSSFSGQYEDLDTPPHRMLLEEKSTLTTQSTHQQQRRQNYAGRK